MADPATHFPAVLSAWTDPGHPDGVVWTSHRTRAEAVEEAGEAALDRRLHRYCGSLLVGYVPTVGVTGECSIDLTAAAEEYAAQSRAEARPRSAA